MAGEKIRDAGNWIGRRSGGGGDAGDGEAGKKWNEATEHGVSGFAEGDEFDAGNVCEVAGPSADGNAAAGAADAAFHGEGDIDGRERFVKNAARDLLGIGHERLRFLKHFRIQHVWRAVPAEESGDVVRGHGGHFRTSFDAGGAHVRRHDDIGTLEAGMDEGLLFENVEGGAGDFFGFESVNERGFVNDGAAGSVDYKRGGLHAKKFWNVEQAARFGIERNVKRDEIRFGQESI